MVRSKIYRVFRKAGTGRVTASARAAEHARNRSLRWLTLDPNHFNARRQKATCRTTPGLFVTGNFQGFDPAEDLRRQRGQDSSRQIHSIFLTAQVARCGGTTPVTHSLIVSYSSWEACIARWRLCLDA